MADKAWYRPNTSWYATIWACLSTRSCGFSDCSYMYCVYTVTHEHVYVGRRTLTNLNSPLPTKRSKLGAPQEYGNETHTTQGHMTSTITHTQCSIPTIFKGQLHKETLRLRSSTCYMDKTGHLPTYCAWDSRRHLPVTQLSWRSLAWTEMHR